MRWIGLFLFSLLSCGYVKSQERVDTLYNKDGSIEAYGEIRNEKRYGVWYFNFRDGKSYKTINYLENGEALVKYFSDEDLTNAIELDGMRALPYNFKNQIFYLSKYIEGHYSFPDYDITYNGLYYTYYPSANASSKGNVVNDEFDGKLIRNYKSGVRMNVINFSNGKLNGEWITYREEPQLRIWTKGDYYENAKIGTWKEYYSNSQIKEEGAFNADLKAVYITDENINSLQTLYPDIELKYYQMAQFPLNFKSGCWKYYSEKGELTKTEYYEKGQLIKTK